MAVADLQITVSSLIRRKDDGLFLPPNKQRAATANRKKMREIQRERMTVIIAFMIERAINAAGRATQSFSEDVDLGSWH